jgi:hypothetical protein
MNLKPFMQSEWSFPDPEIHQTIFPKKIFIFMNSSISSDEIVKRKRSSGDTGISLSCPSIRYGSMDNRQPAINACTYFSSFMFCSMFLHNFSHRISISQEKIKASMGGIFYLFLNAQFNTHLCESL